MTIHMPGSPILPYCNKAISNTTSKVRIKEKKNKSAGRSFFSRIVFYPRDKLFKKSLRMRDKKYFTNTLKSWTKAFKVFLASSELKDQYLDLGHSDQLKIDKMMLFFSERLQKTTEDLFVNIVSNAINKPSILENKDAFKYDLKGNKNDLFKKFESSMHITDMVTKKVAMGDWSIKKAKLVEGLYHTVQATILLFSAVITVAFSLAVIGVMAYHLQHLIVIASILFAVSIVLFESAAFKEAIELKETPHPTSNQELEKHMNFLKRQFYSIKRNIIDLADVLGKDFGDLSWFFAKF